MKEIHQTEKNFCEQVIVYARLMGWMVYHVFEQETYARRTSKGFPDLQLLKGTEQIVAELKSEKGKVTKEQAEWLAAFKAAGVPTFVWRPSDWGGIEEILKYGRVWARERQKRVWVNGEGGDASV